MMQRLFSYMLLLGLALLLSSATTTEEEFSKKHHLSLSDAAACDNAPILLTASNVTTNAADLSWSSINSPVETRWDVELVEAGTPFSGIPNFSAILQNPFPISNLQAGTRYCFRVRANCGMDGNSAWSATQFCFNTDITNPSNCGLGFPIADNNCGNTNDFQIVVDDVNGTTLGADVRLSEVRILIDHIWEQDLRIRLSAPTGQMINLSTDHGGASVFPPYGDFSNQDCTAYTSFRNIDEACHTYPYIFENNLTTFTGDFFPEVPFTNFNGVNPNGTWTLHICDDAADNIGALEYVELVFEEIACPQASNIQISTITATSALIDWDSGTIGATTDVLVQFTNHPTLTGYTFQDVQAPFEATNLLEGWEYEVQIVESCIFNNGYAVSPCPAFFTTRCDAPSITEVENFDQQPLCVTNCTNACYLNGIWQNIGSPSGNWIAHTGATPTPNTGPIQDFSGQGNYIYLETSNGTCQNNQAILNSNCILVKALDGDCHFSYAYYLFGNAVQELRLEVRTEQSDTWQELTQHIGAVDRYWHTAQVDLSAYHEQLIQLRFVATAGVFDTGDIALDELTFYGSIDAGTPPFVHYLDSDNDTYGDAAFSYRSCAATPIDGYVSNDLDCDDTNAAIHPMAAEIYCNQIDENCNGLGDDSLLPHPIVAPQYICLDEQATFQIETPSVGTYEWFDAPFEGNLLQTGSSYVSANLSNADTFYVEDVVRVQPGLRISEIFMSFTNSAIELQNMGDAQDYTGWQVVISDDDTAINTPQVVTWQLGAFAANEIQTRNRNNWGEPFTWLSIRKGWALLLNPEGGVEDAVFWNWEEASIATFAINVGGIQLTATDLPWIGAGIDVQGFCGQALALTGTTETNTASDFLCTGSTLGMPNPSLNLIKECRSPRIAAEVRLHPQAALTYENQVATCSDTQAGTILLTPIGGTAPFQYHWSNGAITQNLVDVPFDTYTVEISDANGCTTVLQDSIRLVASDTIFQVQILERENLVCADEASGFIVVEAMGGFPPYQYNWSIGQERDKMTPNDTLQNLSGGTYQVTVTDGQGCVETTELVLLEAPTPINLSALDIQDVACFGMNTGQINVEANGGVSPYAYIWSNGDSTAVPQNLSGGGYDLTIQDANNCTFVIENIIVDEPTAPLSFTLDEIQNVTCFGAADGLLRFDIDGGTAPFSYTWNNGISALAEATGLSGGSYQLTITDANGCFVATPLVPIAEASAPLEANPIVEAVPCEGVNSGQINLNLSGGYPPYLYKWSNLETTPQIADLGIGTYFCTVIDALGCSYVSPPLALLSDESAAFDVVLLNQIEPDCHDSDNGMIDVDIVGGTSPFVYQWNNGMNEQDLSSIDGGWYQLTVTDANGCINWLEDITLDEPGPILVIDSEVIHDTLNQNTGSIAVEVIGGTPPYTYQWDDPNQQSNAVCTDLGMGIYTVMIEDSNGCSYTESYYVSGNTSWNEPTTVKELRLFPNPTSGYTLLDLELERPQPVAYTLYNMLGEKLDTQDFEPHRNIQIELDLTKQAAGLFYVQLLVGNQRITKRILVQK